MVAANETIEWVSNNPVKLARHIFEGIASSKEYVKEGEPYDTYARLGERFVIRVKRDRVVAEWRELMLHERVETSPKQVHIQASDAATAGYLISQIITKGRPHTIRFEGASLADHQMYDLFTWTEKNDYNIVASETGIVITKDPETKEFAWRPPS
jgi:hypothetical protein